MTVVSVTVMVEGSPGIVVVKLSPWIVTGSPWTVMVWFSPGIVTVSQFVSVVWRMLKMVVGVTFATMVGCSFVKMEVKMLVSVVSWKLVMVLGSWASCEIVISLVIVLGSCGS